jgi:hypothetical protein
MTVPPAFSGVVEKAGISLLLGRTGFARGRCKFPIIAPAACNDRADQGRPVRPLHPAFTSDARAVYYRHA